MKDGKGIEKGKEYIYEGEFKNNLKCGMGTLTIFDIIN